MAKPAVNCTQNILFQKIPILRLKYYDAAAKKMLDRLQAPAGPHKSPENAHATGRALDIVLFSHVPEEVELADEIVQVFLSIKAQMQWSAVIYNKKQFDSRGESTRLYADHLAELKRDKNKKRQERSSYEHHTHIHIEWREVNAGGIGFESDLEKALKKIIIIEGKRFFLDFGDGDPQKIREQQSNLAEKIKAKAGTITNEISIHTDYVVRIGDEKERSKGDPLETDLQKARLFNVEIIETNQLNKKLKISGT
jgi:hypothetical protein